DVEAAVRTRTDLDTPAGARDFQRFLTGKLREIRAVVASAGLDDTSKSALMAAWTSLYNGSRSGQQSSAGQQPPRSVAGASRGTSADPQASDTGMDPYLDALLADDPGLLPDDLTGRDPSPAPPMAPAMPSFPAFGGGAMPAGGALPASLPGFGMPGAFPLGGLLPDSAKERLREGPDDALIGPEELASTEQPSPDEPEESGDEKAAEPTAAPEPQPAGPTTVTLPTGDTVTAASPQLAAAIKAAAGGTPIADAFHQQGITIPPPGTAVSDPVDPSRLAPGDIGMFADRHALALGNSKALLNGQIQHISTVKGPSFLGWEHPPAPVTADAPAKAETPAPTRPAAAVDTSP
ncbi:MAG TPA: DUF4226 domain-containing protein, partial [Mycobacterium sp.]|uniref:DUF4226 domain-containing protein n=1 Tax=Mycobacterium sp. TaxID=1785 RepID=UPI002D4F8119